MWVVIIVIIIFFIIGFVINSLDEETTKNNADEINEILKNKNFKTSKIKVYQGTNKSQLRVDLENKQIALCSIFPYKHIDIVAFSNIIECEIIEDSNTIMKGGVGRAVVGGVLAGGVGALVGANTRKSRNVTNNLQIRIITKNINKSLYTIDLITSETQKDTLEYKSAMRFANDVYATITSIINSNTENNQLEIQRNKVEENNVDFIEQLERLYKLKNDGVITDKEFKESKQMVLASKDMQSNVENNIQEEYDFNDNDDIYHIKEKAQLYGDNKIQIIGDLRRETGLGLTEAKEIVDNYFKNR